MLEFFRAYY